MKTFLNGIWKLQLSNLHEMIFLVPSINVLRQNMLYTSRRTFPLLLIEKNDVKLRSFKIQEQVPRNFHRPVTLAVQAHEDLLRVLEKHIQSLKSNKCTSCGEEQKCHRSIANSNNHQICKSYSAHHGEKHQNNVISSKFNSSSTDVPHPYYIKFGQNINPDEPGRERFVAGYDPSTTSRDVYRTTPMLEEFVKAHPISETYKSDENKITSKVENSDKNLPTVKDDKIPSKARDNKKTSKAGDNKKTSKVKFNKNSHRKSEAIESNEKLNYFMRSLCSYIQVCRSVGMVNHAHKALLYYRFKNNVSKKYSCSVNIDIYNAVLHCWAELGNLEKVETLFRMMAEDNITPNLQSCACYLECLTQPQYFSSPNNKTKIKEMSIFLEKQGKKFSDIFYECTFSKDQLKAIIEVLKLNMQDFPYSQPDIPHVPYICNLLENLNTKNHEKATNSPFVSTSISKSNNSKLTSDQLQLETEYFVKVKSVNVRNDVSEKTLRMRKCVKQCEDVFKKVILSALEAKISNMWESIKAQKCMTLYPYLCAVDRETVVNLLLQEIRNLAETAEYFSPNIRMMCSIMGNKVMDNYFISLRKKNKVTEKIAFIHSKYTEYLLNSELIAKYTPREYWEYLKRVHFEGPTIDVPDLNWPHHIVYEVGKFLYEILLETLTFDANILRPNAKSKLVVRPFYTTYEQCKKLPNTKTVGKLSLQIRAHPKICKLYQESERENLEFDVSMVPMVCPPRPWVKLKAGGLLMTRIPFIRLPTHAHQQNAYYNKIPNEQLFPCFDSLNNLSVCPWIINKPILDAIIKIFKSGGCVELDIPLNLDKFANGPKIKSSMTDEEKKKLKREKAAFNKMKLESGSLWFDCLYKLSIANYFRDTIFWFPHNLDFRGRVYPTPPHFNHLGSDLVRSMLLFAEGRPLGPNGLNWLKIHLINLTGFKKRDSNSDRLKYADEILEDILDSADKPFTGRQWWKTSDEPWQTLACCKEVAKAVRSPDPITFVSHFPVHQDGSCNGLQHYAALGRDELGAKEVNLFPADRPQDVYAGVAALVEAERKKDAAEGSEIAKALEGFVKRKVVKQTIMTFVYGVTEFGAKQQILKKLNDYEFPDELCHCAARYLMKQTFASIKKMFTATREIQKWFTDSAELITRLSEEPVEWITPLGLPVIQPYHRKATVRSLTDFIAEGKTGLSIFHGTATSSYESTYETYQLPNVRKQKNAFAPNFIHSLDSSHMMLTSLFCQREGITFVSVHDCYWTHPITVEVMNQVCRQQFVSLHNQRILENLSNFFMQKYLPKDDSKLNENQRERLSSVLSAVPKKGTFELLHVLNSVYFFS